jgi:membrane protein involved in colicin uptake
VRPGDDIAILNGVYSEFFGRPEIKFQKNTRLAILKRTNDGFRKSISSEQQKPEVKVANSISAERVAKRAARVKVMELQREAKARQRAAEYVEYQKKDAEVSERRRQQAEKDAAIAERRRQEAEKAAAKAAEIEEKAQIKASKKKAKKEAAKKKAKEIAEEERKKLGIFDQDGNLIAGKGSPRGVEDELFSTDSSREKRLSWESAVTGKKKKEHGVDGHWRTLESGKRVWVRGHKRGGR